MSQPTAIQQCSRTDSRKGLARAMGSAFSVSQEHLGHDDHGNQLYRVTFLNPKDPDDHRGYLDTELTY